MLINYRSRGEKKKAADAALEDFRAKLVKMKVGLQQGTSLTEFHSQRRDLETFVQLHGVELTPSQFVNRSQRDIEWMLEALANVEKRWDEEITLSSRFGNSFEPSAALRSAIKDAITQLDRRIQDHVAASE